LQRGGEAFKNLKGDLAIRPVFQAVDRRHYLPGGFPACEPRLGRREFDLPFGTRFSASPTAISPPAITSA
jgi:hypothetical protein